MCVLKSKIAIILNFIALSLLGNEIPNIPNLIRIFDNAIISTYPSYVCTLSVRSTDPESDNIYYEIQWDLDPNFMSASSDTIGPYISGDNVITTIPVATETLYYWRARATDDPLLISNWSCWSLPGVKCVHLLCIWRLVMYTGIRLLGTHPFFQYYRYSISTCV